MVHGQTYEPDGSQCLILVRCAGSQANATKWCRVCALVVLFSEYKWWYLLRLLECSV